MNLCVVSTFDSTVDDFRAMVADFEEEALRTCISEYEIAVINDHKTCMMFNVTDMEALQTMMSSPKMTEWDAANNCVDVVYSLEQIN